MLVSVSFENNRVLLRDKFALTVSLDLRLMIVFKE